MYNFFRFLVHLFSFVINTTHLSATQIAIQIATQSSTYGVDYAASRAIDGNVSTISHTADNVLQPHWLELDLGKEYAITNVTVVNRWNWIVVTELMEWSCIYSMVSQRQHSQHL